MYLGRVLNATQFCTILYRAGRAGNPVAARYGFNPESTHTGHFNRHLKSVMGEVHGRRALLYRMTMPGASRKATGRVVHDIDVWVPFEKIDADVRAEQGMLSLLLDAIDDGSLPPAYFTHPLVQNRAADDDPILPLNLFVDGVVYSLTDSVVGFWFINVITGRRYLFAVIRKRLL